MNYLLKYSNDDFLVREVWIEPRYVKYSNARFTILQLKKCNINTFDAISEFSKLIGVHPSQISYSGLKDEDGITTQIISVEHLLKEDYSVQLNCYSGAWVNLKVLGYSREPLYIGRLLGNTFEVTLRGIDKGQYDQFMAFTKGSTKISIINYYDNQRFGIPKSLHNTHIIGKCILEGNWQEALKEYLKSGNSKEEKNLLLQRSKVMSCEQAFRQTLDYRKLSFLLNSYMSYQWNQRVSRLFKQSGLPVHSFDNEVMQLTFINDLCDTMKIQNYDEYIFFTCNEDSSFVEHSKKRRLLIDSDIFLDVTEDDLFDNRIKVDLNFYMPSGSYATMLVKQLMDYIAQ